MQAITLWQPWATLIALGVKNIETRSWPAPADLVGQRLAIHAAQRTPGDELRAAFQNPFIRAALWAWGITETNWTGGAGSLPQGAVLAVATLKACLPMEPGGGLVGLGELEAAFGNYSPGRWAWLLSDVVNMNSHPVAVRGRQRIWTLPLHTVAILNGTADQLGQLPAGGFR